jgi:tRNA uridine 5-carboxymethylaminomethyl modification enzyme
LTPKGQAVGLVGAVRARAHGAKARALAQARTLLEGLSATPTEIRGAGIEVNLDGVRRGAADLLAHPDLDMARLGGLWPRLAHIPADIAGQLQIEARYRGYIRRQDADIRAFRRDESLALPADLDFDAMPGLSAEARLKLARARPATIAAAARLSGVTPAALTILLGQVRRDGRLTA